MSGIVYLVGAGPGDPGLITRRGAELLARADVVVYDGLVAHQLVALAPASAERIYAGKKRAAPGAPLSQAEINDVLVDRGRAGKRVVRLKGGDPFVFGRGAEECAALFAAGIAFEIVPGVSAATAVAAYAGIPLTARGVASTVALATGHEAAGKPTENVDWEALARAGTVLLFMACATIDECTQKLIAAGRAADDPAAAIRWGTTAAQRTVTAPLSKLAASAAGCGLKPPVLIVVGPSVALRDELSWHEKRPLASTRVVFTRAADRAERYAAAIADLGGEPDFCPVTRSVPASDPSDLQRAATELANGGFDWVAFASARGVDALFDALAYAGHDARALAGVQVAAVGAATATALATRGIRADVVPERSYAEDLAAAMLAFSPGRVLLPRAAGGREILAQRLGDAGWKVREAVAYETVPNAGDAVIAPVLARLRAPRDGAFVCVCAFAPSQVAALCDLLGDDAPAVLGNLDAVAAIGDTTAAAFAARGVDVSVIPSRPDPESLARALSDHLAKTQDARDAIS